MSQDNLPALRHAQPLGLPSEHEMMVFNTMAAAAVDSKMYRGIGDKSGVMMIMLSARELGIPAMSALNGGIHIVQGKAEISARMMNALIRKAGHQIKIKESTDDICTLTGIRSDTGEVQDATFTIGEAQKAGLVKPGGGWVKCPKDMLFARAISRLARQLFPDVIGIGYVEGEIKAVEAVNAVPDDVPTIELDTYDQDLQKLLGMFEDDDQFLIQEYMSVVMKHFQWTNQVCVKKFLEEKDLMDKFTKWKIKRNPS